MPNTARAKREFLQNELTEHGKFSELLHMNVPFPVDPTVMLVSVLPAVRPSLRGLDAACVAMLMQPHTVVHRPWAGQLSVWHHCSLCLCKPLHVETRMFAATCTKTCIS